MTINNNYICSITLVYGDHCAGPEHDQQQQQQHQQQQKQQQQDNNLYTNWRVERHFLVAPLTLGNHPYNTPRFLSFTIIIIIFFKIENDFILLCCSHIS